MSGEIHFRRAIRTVPVEWLRGQFFRLKDGENIGGIRVPLAVTTA
jgi:hypothetical protein